MTTMKNISQTLKAALLLSLMVVCSNVFATDYYLLLGYSDDQGGWESKGKMTSLGSNNYSINISLSNGNSVFMGASSETTSCTGITTSELTNTAKNSVAGLHGGIEVRSNDRCQQGTDRYFIYVKSPEVRQLTITYNSSTKTYTIESNVTSYSVTASLTGTATLSPPAGVAQSVTSGGSITFNASEMPTGHKITGATYTGTGTASYTDNTATVSGVGSNGTLNITVACGGATNPTVTTGTTVSATNNSATISGNNITSAGLTGACATGSISGGGVQYGTTSGSLNLTQDCSRSSTGQYSASLSGLSANTTYYYRAYATNGNGTAYGEEQHFTTQAVATYRVCGNKTSVFGGSNAWDTGRTENNMTYSDGYYTKTFEGVNEGFEFKIWDGSSYPTQTYTSTLPTDLDGIIALSQTNSSSNIVVAQAACGSKTGSEKCSAYDITIMYDAATSKVYAVCVPSLYFKGPLVTGAWGSYQRFTTVRKDASGNWVYSASFTANSGCDGNCDNNQGKFAICTTTNESDGVKLPNEVSYTSTYGLVGCERIKHDDYWNFKTKVGMSGTLYLYVTRYDVEDYRVVLSTSSLGSDAKVWLGATPLQDRLNGHLAKTGCADITDWGFYYSTTPGITQQQVLADFSGDKDYILEAEEPSSPEAGDEFSLSNPAFKNIVNQTLYVVAYVKNSYDLSISDELALYYCGQSFTLSGTGSVSATTSYPWEATTVTASDATGAVGYVWRIYSYDADDYLPQSSDTEVEYNYVFGSTETAHQYLFKGPYDSTLGKTNKYIMRVTASDGTCDATRDYTFSIISGPNVVCD